MKKITLQSGKILEITLAPFEAASTLNKALMKELLKVDIDMNADLGDPSVLKVLICTVGSSKEIMDAAMECMKKCAYDGQRITSEEIFESEEARGDYYEIVRNVIIENVRPFLKALLSQSKAG